MLLLSRQIDGTNALPVTPIASTILLRTSKLFCWIDKPSRLYLVVSVDMLHDPVYKLTFFHQDYASSFQMPCHMVMHLDVVGNQQTLRTLYVRAINLPNSDIVGDR